MELDRPIAIFRFGEFYCRTLNDEGFWSCTGGWRTSFRAHFPRGMIGNHWTLFLNQLDLWEFHKGLRRCSKICQFVTFSGTSWDDKRSLQLTSSACSVRCRFLQYSEKVFAELVDRVFPDIQIYMTNVKSEDAIGNASSFWVLLQAPLKESRLYELRVLLGSHGEFVGHSPALMARSCPFNWKIYTYEKINEHDNEIMIFSDRPWDLMGISGFPTFSISDRTKASW